MAERPGRRPDWFTIIAAVALVVGVLAMLGGVVLTAAAFFFVGA